MVYLRYIYGHIMVYVMDHIGSYKMVYLRYYGYYI